MQNLGDALHLNGREVYFSPDDKAILYSGLGTFPDFSAFASAYVFDARNGQIIRTFTLDGENLQRSLAWSPDGSQVAAGCSSGIHHLGLRNRQTVATLVHSENKI
jgi:WD40 repeat protein